MFKIFFILLSIIQSSTIEELPQGLTQEELENIDIIYSMGSRTEPPIGPVRNIAEYDPMQGVLIRYPFGISTSIINEMSDDVIVYCLVSSNQQNSAYNAMNNAANNASRSGKCIPKPTPPDSSPPTTTSLESI